MFRGHEAGRRMAQQKTTDVARCLEYSKHRRGWLEMRLKRETGQGLESHGKDLGLYLTVRVKPLKGFKKDCDKIPLAFWKDFSSCYIKNILEGCSVKAGWRRGGGVGWGRSRGGRMRRI